MLLDLFNNLKEKLESNPEISNFMKTIYDDLNSLEKNDLIPEKENTNLTTNSNIAPNTTNITNTTITNNIQPSYLKENHLYLVTEDRLNSFYIWDFTDKPKKEFEIKNPAQELLNIAKEGSLLIFKNGELKFHSYDGYTQLFDEKNKK